MAHERYTELIQLMLYDELGEAERRELEAHIAGCPACAEEAAALGKFNALLTASAPGIAPEHLLDAARLELRASLARPRTSMLGGLLDGLRDLLFPRIGYAAGAAAMAALGIAAGYLIFAPAKVAAPPVQVAAVRGEGSDGDVRITNVRFLNTGDGSGDVEFAFEAVKPMHMKGNINDEKIQKILTHAMLNEQNPGVRLKSVSAIATTTSPDNEVKAALVTALMTDENPGVRKEALKALRTFPFDRDIKSVYLYVLMHDTNAGLRIAAINQLDSSATAGGTIDQEVLNVMKERMRSDENNYIRLRAKAVVDEVNQ